jgi:hypothetical protein
MIVTIPPPLMVIILNDSLIIRFLKAASVLPAFVKLVRGSNVQSTLFGYPTHSTKYKSQFLDCFFPCIVATSYFVPQLSPLVVVEVASARKTLALCMAITVLHLSLDKSPSMSSATSTNRLLPQSSAPPGKVHIFSHQVSSLVCQW